MKKEEIEIGKCYLANVSNKRTTVRVVAIRKQERFRSRQVIFSTVFDVVNLKTNKSLTFKSAMRFLSRAVETSAPPNPQLKKKVHFLEKPPELTMSSRIKNFLEKTKFEIVYFKLSGKYRTSAIVYWPIKFLNDEKQSVNMTNACAKLRGLRDNGGPGALPGLSGEGWDGFITIDSEKGFPCLILPGVI